MVCAVFARLRGDCARHPLRQLDRSLSERLPAFADFFVSLPDNTRQNAMTAMTRSPTPATAPAPPDERWRDTHLGRLLGRALQRFDSRVLQLMARNVEVPLALSHLAARGQISAAHVHITRHLAPQGERLTLLARRAAMSKQAMADLVSQCAAWGLVERRPDALDARARRVCWTPVGLAWLQAFRDAVAQAEAEFREELGQDVAAVVAIGLEAYSGAADG